MEALEELLESMPAKIRMYKKDKDNKYYGGYTGGLLYIMKSSSHLQRYEVFYRTVEDRLVNCDRTPIFTAETLFEAVFNLKCYLKTYNDEVKSQLNEEIWIQ